MARREPQTAAETFEQRAAAFLATHQRIISDFERSLKNARHFIKLGERSLEQEPEATIQMIEQVREIDLLGHISRQFEEYQSVAGLLPGMDGEVEAESVQDRIRALRLRYEQLVEEAESQAEEMEKLISALTTPH